MQYVSFDKDYVTRIHLKTACENREELVDFCLSDSSKQFLVIGWSYIYSDNSKPADFNEFYDWVKEDVDRINPAFNLFKNAVVNDLFWTRDLDGFYWICKVKEPAKAYCDKGKDIGAILPVEAYKYGMEVPGQIKASFNRPRGGIAERIYDDVIIEYSKHIFNQVSGRDIYRVNKELQSNLLDNLPDFELEELVISYIQIKYDYYLLSNSIANKSTTIAIECEFCSRNIADPKKAVVQVKGKKGKTLVASDYRSFIDNGYQVFLFAPRYEKDIENELFVYIEKADLLKFVNEYRSILPENITQWMDIFH